MSFVIAKRPIAAFPLSILVHGQDGKPQKIDFVAHYHRHTSEQLADLQDAMANLMRARQGLSPISRPDGSDIPAWPYVRDVDFVKEKLAGWADVIDASGNAVSFSPVELAATLETWPELISPLFNGFFDAHREAREKNL